MITITVAFQGEPENLQDASVCAIHFASTRRFVGNRLIAKYVCETDNYDQAMTSVMESINIDQVEELGCELLWIQ
jgi:hypothetical protein